MTIEQKWGGKGMARLLMNQLSYFFFFLPKQYHLHNARNILKAFKTMYSSTWVSPQWWGVRGSSSAHFSFKWTALCWWMVRHPSYLSCRLSGLYYTFTGSWMDANGRSWHLLFYWTFFLESGWIRLVNIQVDQKGTQWGSTLFVIATVMLYILIAART